MVKCGDCGRFLRKVDGVRCCGRNCGEAFYHKACVGLTPKAIAAPNWRCPECLKSLLRNNKADTPEGNTCSQIGSDSSPSVASSQTSPADKTDPGLVSAGSGINVADITAQLLCPISPEYQLLLNELKAIRTELSSFRNSVAEELAALKGSMQSHNERVDKLENRIGVLEQKTIDSAKLDGVIKELRLQLNERDQDLLANDIEISNLPETNAENPVHIVMTIGLKLGVKLDERDVVSAERVGRRQLNATSPEGPAEIRSRPIVARLTRRCLRDEILKNARVRRGATTADLDMAGPAKRFYVNERLTKANRQLFRRARDAAAQAGWRFVWTKHGRILACCKPGDPTKQLRNEADIQAIFAPTVPADVPL